MTDTPKYPGIERACLEIAYDNGGINRWRSEKQAKREIREWLERRDDQDVLPAIDAWLAPLDEDTLQVVCAGEEKEMLAAMADAPPFTHELLNDYFKGPC